MNMKYKSKSLFNISFDGHKTKSLCNINISDSEVNNKKKETEYQKKERIRKIRETDSLYLVELE